MSYLVENLPGENIVIQTLNADFSPAEEGVDLVEITLNILINLQERLMVICNMRPARLTFEAVVFGDDMADQQKVFEHPLVRKSIFVPPEGTVVLAPKMPNLLAVHQRQVRLV